MLCNIWAAVSFSMGVTLILLWFNISPSVMIGLLISVEDYWMFSNNYNMNTGERMIIALFIYLKQNLFSLKGKGEFV